MTKKTKIKKDSMGKMLTDAKPQLTNSLSCFWPFMGLGIAGIILVLDQLSKWIVLNHLMIPPQNLQITSFFNIILAWNRGVSFGLLSSNNPYGVWILAGIAFAFAFVLIAWIWRSDSKMLAIAFGMVLGGAVGNLIDRLRFGAVTDFLDFHIHGYHWYTFNIADIGIVVGVGLVIIEHLKELWVQK